MGVKQVNITSKQLEKTATRHWGFIFSCCPNFLKFDEFWHTVGIQSLIGPYYYQQICRNSSPCLPDGNISTGYFAQLHTKV